MIVTATALPPSAATLGPAIVISACALIFTVASFWWLHARPGHLSMTEVRVFSAYVQPDGAVLRIPVTLYNTGAKPLVVVDLRAHLSSAGLADIAPTRTHRTAIRPDPDDIDYFPQPYVVPGRSVVTKFVEFTAKPAVLATGEPAALAIDALIGGRGWRRVGSSEVRTDAIGDPGNYITYSSDPAHWPAGQLEKARAALASVRSGIKPDLA